MNHKILFPLWGILFILCAGLGFLPESNGWMTALSVLFFLPPAGLLYQKERNTVLLVRNLSILSLGLTVVVLSLNFALAVSSETLGNILHSILIIVSAPMVCSGCWVLSLFLWACLLITSHQQLKKR